MHLSLSRISCTTKAVSIGWEGEVKMHIYNQKWNLSIQSNPRKEDHAFSGNGERSEL